jgi:hypothetical protein
MVNVKGKAVPTHAMKANRSIRCTVPLILNFGEWFEDEKYLFPLPDFQPPSVGAMPTMVPRLPSLIMTDH